MALLYDINLYLVRHGESEGNVDRHCYAEKADHAILLTERGQKQARACGVFMRERLQEEFEKSEAENFGRLRVWNSPYYRARQTALPITHELGRVFNWQSGDLTYRENPFIHEQRAGLYDGLTHEEMAKAHPADYAHFEKQQSSGGKAYADNPLGESCLDLMAQNKSFLNTIMRDAMTQDIRTLVIVSHGVTLRTITATLMNYPPEWVQAEKNPGNCWTRHISGTISKEWGTVGHGFGDHGYVFGEGAPLGDPQQTQISLPHAENVVMLEPQRTNTPRLKGVRYLNPFDYTNE